MNSPKPGAESLLWRQRGDHLHWLREQSALQLRFGGAFEHPTGGAAYLNEHGEPDLSQPVHTWVTARMLHVYSLGSLAGVPGCATLAQVALRGLTGSQADAQHRGWVNARGPGDGLDDSKTAYTHAFVVFAASSAVIAGLEGANDLLDEALATLDDRFWEPEAGMHLDSASPDWSTHSDYRGVNANMHSVEALLNAANATGEDRWRERAQLITTQVLGWAQTREWRIPEHFDATWTELPQHHRDQPDHPFEPFGATVGHGLEWARLAVQVAAAGGDEASNNKLEASNNTLIDGATQLFDRAVTDGWAVDGQDGFVYTTDWSGQPVVRRRMHWVLCEGISAAAALAQATGLPRFEQWYQRWWDHAAQHYIADNGSWQHEMDETNTPSNTVWPGRPDLYHSFHAVVLPRLPLAPMAAAAIAGGHLL